LVSSAATRYWLDCSIGTRATKRRSARDQQRRPKGTSFRGQPAMTKYLVAPIWVVWSMSHSHGTSWGKGRSKA
jgi:hypothetical protein